MIHVVTGGCRKLAGGRRRLTTVLGALAVFVAACPVASAQLPVGPIERLTADVVKQLPGDAVEQVLNEPLPSPVEEVLSDSPVAPVREEIRRLVGGATGDSGGGGTGDTPADTPAGDASRPPAPAAPAAEATPAGSAPPSTGRARGDRPQRNSPRRTGRRGGSERRAERRATPAAEAGTPSSGRPRGRVARETSAPAEPDDAGNPLTRTVDKLVEVVPAWVWIALGALGVLALLLGARTLVDRRRARLLEADREQLRREIGLLERLLLPDVPPRLGQLEASVAYRPCDGPAAGGDFYDAFELPDGRVAVLVGDVSGHGPDALERTNTIRSELHACLEAGMSPRAALDSVGRRARVEPNGRFITVVAAVHDPASGTFTYATAGHPPPILLGSSHHEPLTTVSSPPIGLGFRTGLRQTTVPLAAGSVVCLFTDGLVEARVEDGLLGRDRLAAMVGELGPGDPADALLDAVRAVSDGPPDDMAVCLLRPLSDASPSGRRVELLEVEAADDLDRGAPERFLAVCGVSGDDAVSALEETRSVVMGAGAAVLEVTLDEAAVRVEVSPAATFASPASA